MATEEMRSGQFRDDFYRDGFGSLVLSFSILLISALIVSGLSVWILTTRPAPQYFKTDTDWRVVPPVPVKQPYIPVPNLVQWVSDVLPMAFTVDFVNYSAEVANSLPYFTEDGWKKFQQVLQVYASPGMVEKNRLFVTATAGGAPFILNQGLISGSYGWWIQMPLNLSYSSSVKGSSKSLVVQALVVRVPTLDDLKGIRIDKLIVKVGEEDQGATNE